MVGRSRPTVVNHDSTNAIEMKKIQAESNSQPAVKINLNTNQSSKNILVSNNSNALDSSPTESAGAKEFPKIPSENKQENVSQIVAKILSSSQHLPSFPQSPEAKTHDGLAVPESGVSDPDTENDEFSHFSEFYDRTSALAKMSKKKRTKKNLC